MGLNSQQEAFVHLYVAHEDGGVFSLTSGSPGLYHQGSEDKVPQKLRES